MIIFVSFRFGCMFTVLYVHIFVGIKFHIGVRCNLIYLYLVGLFSLAAVNAHRSTGLTGSNKSIRSTQNDVKSTLSSRSQIKVSSAQPAKKNVVRLKHLVVIVYIKICGI